MFKHLVFSPSFLLSLLCFVLPLHLYCLLPQAVSPSSLARLFLNSCGPPHGCIQRFFFLSLRVVVSPLSPGLRQSSLSQGFRLFYIETVGFILLLFCGPCGSSEILPVSRFSAILLIQSLFLLPPGLPPELLVFPVPPQCLHDLFDASD